jgi:DNA-binding NarL/FixJ family response regulator
MEVLKKNQELNILILNNNMIVHYGVKHLLSALTNKIYITSARNCSEFMEMIADRNFDMMILDYNPSNLAEWTTIKNAIKQNKSKILIFSEFADPHQIKILYRMGIKGYINVTTDTNEITNAISTIMKGGRYIPQFISELLAEEFLSVKNQRHTLTEREIQILKYLLKGDKSKDIASSLGIHSSTIGTYKFRILNKLKVPNVIKLKEYVEKFQPELL